ncbi:MAG: hypothetical protein LBG92_09950, partial [Prevotellaceae bacterium]|nr:hypothetical protein [Prevotellaceae bacterium]
MYKQLKNICSGLFAVVMLLLQTLESEAQVNSLKRFEIDLRRQELLSYDYNSNELMLRAKEFIRKDPDYYVGYLLEGLYRYSRSGDAAGYIYASKPLKQAIELLEKDYAAALRDVYSSQEAYAEYGLRINDYIQIVDKLMECYSNIERPDSVIWLLNRYKSWNFSHDGLGADNYIAWTYHRNRFYTSQKFDFLYNSVSENEAAALYFLKRNLETIDKNEPKNENIINPIQILASRLGVYHYMSIIYSYLHRPDSAAMYFNYMRPYRGVFPYNNFAIFNFVNGEFERAYDFFQTASYYSSDKYRLQEYIYYMSILNVMQGTPQESATDLALYIRETGVRPGWGWYNIGLARAYMYNGQLDSSLICINKAAKFNDVHIGTTWGQSHYLFSHSMLRLIALQRKEAAVRFEDKYYWSSPAKLRKIIEYKLEQYVTLMSIFNQLSSNPERSDVYYRLFASEATVSFDEIYCMIKDYGRNFFIKEFEKHAKNDERKLIRKYFDLFRGKLHVEKGDNKNALKILEDIYNHDAPSENKFEKLYNARLYEALSLANSSSGTGENHAKFRMRFYTEYPQLAPFSKLQMKFTLKTEINDNETAKAVLSDMESFNIDFTDEKEKNVPVVKLSFGKIKDRNEIKYS